MPFAFYGRLSAAKRRVYDRSDTLNVPPLHAEELMPLGVRLQAMLEAADQAGVRKAAQALADALGAQLDLPAVRISVLRTRPQRGGSEYHGYYDGADDGKPARITVWMFTARRRQVVAHRTFLRTLVHELCHHLDFEGFRLDESFHTEGFYRRESALFRAVLGERPATPGPRQAPAH